MCWHAFPPSDMVDMPCSYPVIWTCRVLCNQEVKCVCLALVWVRSNALSTELTLLSLSITQHLAVSFSTSVSSKPRFPMQDVFHCFLSLLLCFSPSFSLSLSPVVSDEPWIQRLMSHEWCGSRLHRAGHFSQHLTSSVHSAFNQVFCVLTHPSPNPPPSTAGFGVRGGERGVLVWLYTPPGCVKSFPQNTLTHTHTHTRTQTEKARIFFPSSQIILRHSLQNLKEHLRISSTGVQTCRLWNGVPIAKGEEKNTFVRNKHRNPNFVRTLKASGARLLNMPWTIGYILFPPSASLSRHCIFFWGLWKGPCSFLSKWLRMLGGNRACKQEPRWENKTARKESEL